MYKNTEQKRIILDAFKKGYFPTADELLQKIRKSYPDYSRATLYRNLASFCESGELKKISVAGQTDRFTNNVDCNYHLVCEVCGKIEDLNMPNAIQAPSKLLDYEIDYHELTFYGVCPNCQKK